MSEPIVAVAITSDKRRRLTEAQRKQLRTDRKCAWVVDETANGRIWHHGKLSEKKGREEHLSAEEIAALQRLLLSRVARSTEALLKSEGPTATKRMERLARKLEPEAPRGGRAIRRHGQPPNQTWSFIPRPGYRFALILVPLEESDVEPEPVPTEPPLATEKPRVSCRTKDVRSAGSHKLIVANVILINENPMVVRVDDLVLKANGKEVGSFSQVELPDPVVRKLLKIPPLLTVPLDLPPSGVMHGTVAFSAALPVGKDAEIAVLASFPLSPT